MEGERFDIEDGQEECVRERVGARREGIREEGNVCIVYVCIYAWMQLYHASMYVYNLFTWSDRLGRLETSMGQSDKTCEATMISKTNRLRPRSRI